MMCTWWFRRLGAPPTCCAPRAAYIARVHQDRQAGDIHVMARLNPRRRLERNIRAWDLQAREETRAANTEAWLPKGRVRSSPLANFQGVECYAPRRLRDPEVHPTTVGTYLSGRAIPEEFTVRKAAPKRSGAKLWAVSGSVKGDFREGNPTPATAPQPISPNALLREANRKTKV